ncbi:quinolinate synthase NadA [Mollicutes bacterium LVI A0039]|nr:quinolinate synthase NadA [Mollicutes bacterium LVI A0039]
MNEQLIAEINELKLKHNAVILAHYYQSPEIQDIADYVGDSLALSIAARDTDADLIVFCGVHFMAETAKIISPEKMVILPDLDAGCPMADMVTSEGVIAYKEAHPNAKVMCYVNSTAAVKAVSDVCVTSTNAQKIAKHYVGEQMLYVPDQNLGEYLNQQVPGLDLDLWPGHCCIHNNIKVDKVVEMRAKHPNSQLIVHPECNPKVVALADFVGSTQALLNYVIASEDTEFIIGTEHGIIHQMNKQTTGKQFHLLTDKLVCRNMKKITLDKVAESMRELTNQIELDEQILIDAKRAVDKMLELS